MLPSCALCSCYRTSQGRLVCRAPVPRPYPRQKVPSALPHRCVSLRQAARDRSRALAPTHLFPLETPGGAQTLWQDLFPAPIRHVPCCQVGRLAGLLGRQADVPRFRHRSSPLSRGRLQRRPYASAAEVPRPSAGGAECARGADEKGRVED